MSLRARAPGIAAAAWLAGIVVLLVVVTAMNPPLAHAAQRLLPLAFAFVIMAATCGLGLPLARWLTPNADGWTQWLAGACLGLGLTALLTLMLGIAGSFSRGVYIAWFLIGLASALNDAWQRRARPLPRVEPTSWDLLACGILALFTIPFLPFVVAPVTSSDSLQYHLLIPQIYLAEGSIHRIPLLVEASYPSLAEYVYLPVLMLGGDIACNGLNFWIAMLMLVAIGRLSAAAWPGSSPLLAPALYLSMPMTVIHAGWAWNDFTFTLMVLMALLFLVKHHATPPSERTARVLFVAGIMLGLASWTKYTFVLVSLALVPLFILAWRRWGWTLRQLAAFVAGGACVAPFWLVQNAVLVGNPVYPFLNGIFRSPYWTEAANAFFTEALRRHDNPGWNAWTYFTFPFDLTIAPRILELHPGIVPLALAPLLFLRTSSRELAVLRAYAAFFVLAWLAVQTAMRSWMSLLAVVIIIGCGWIQQHSNPWQRIAPILRPLLAVAVAAAFYLSLTMTQHLMSPVDWFLGRESKEAYLLRMAPSHRAYDWLNQQADVGGVLLVGLHAPYYLEKPYMFSSFTDPPVAEVLLGGSASVDEMHDRLSRRGITHVVVNAGRTREQAEAGLYSWPEEQAGMARALLAERCDVVAHFDGDSILRVR